MDAETDYGGMVSQKIIQFNAAKQPGTGLSNAEVLAGELRAFTQFLAALGFASEAGLDTARLVEGKLEIDLPELAQHPCSYAEFVSGNAMTRLQRSIFILILLPELRPGILDQLFVYDQRIEKGMADLSEYLLKVK